MEDEIAAIRARHEAVELALQTTGLRSQEAHADRATLLRALDEAQERVKRLERALAIYDRCADNCINHAMFSDKQTVVDDIAQAVRNARAALKETGQ